MKFKIVLVFILFFHLSQAQIGIGKWREHLSYSQGLAVCKAENKIYCASYPSLYSYDLTDNSVEKLSKVNGLSDIEVNVVKYSDTYKTLIIGYNSGNIDLVVNNEIINVPDIKRSLIQANKAINEIYIKDNYAYLSTGFGIIVFDIERKEIKETYIPGAFGGFLTINEITIQNDTIFAATTSGIYYGSLNKNLADFQNWNVMSGITPGNYNSIVSFNNKIITNFKLLNGYDKDTVWVYESSKWNKAKLGWTYNYGNVADFNVSSSNKLLVSYEYGVDILNENLDIIEHVVNYGASDFLSNTRELIEDNGNYWIADWIHGLILKNSISYESYRPTGPYFSDAWGMDYSAGHLWMATGTLTSNMKYNFNNKGIAHFYNNEWTSYFGGETFDSLRDIHTLICHPDNPEHIYAASWGGGLLEFKDGKRVKIFNETNSAVQSLSLFPFRPIGGLVFDSSKNLWLTNSGNVSNPLVVLDKDQTWHSFSLNNFQSSGSSYLKDLIIDKNNYKWMLSYLKGIIVFSDNGTLDDSSDDKQVILTVGESSGNLPSNEISAIAEDTDGKIWIGGSAGLSVFNTPQNIFEEGGTDAERFIIQKDTTASYLLSDETITVIKINAANQKWIGTKGSGVYLMSADMQEEIHHFTTLNSPLLSDVIYAIEIDDKTGEVYFSTSSGLISFMGSATDSENYSGPAYAFPNPVPPSYTGTIGIRGLNNNSEVKITDISGNLIYETMAEGGTATWDGKSLNGKKAQSGVYIVFASSSDGKEKQIIKLLFLN